MEDHKADSKHQFDFIEPKSNQYTVYSKSGCSYCTKVKTVLTEMEQPFFVVDCDDYLLDWKKEFLLYIKLFADKEWKTFPIVFDGKKFIGGYHETVEYLEKTLDFNEEF